MEGDAGEAGGLAVLAEACSQMGGPVRRRTAIAAEDISVVELATEAEPQAEFAGSDAEITKHIHRVGCERDRAEPRLSLRRRPRDRGVPVLPPE
jgi:hypothetical protein